MATAVIEVKNVWKVYKMGKVDVPALRGLSLNIKKGEFVIIMGPSGSGKSTAMNCIGCLDVPTKGRVFLDGKDISKMNESRLAQIRGRRIGFIFQTFNLINTLSAIENVTLPMVFRGAYEADRKERAAQLLVSVGLSKRMYHKPAELSGGEQQRVAIARALANDPEIILADEPTGNLDSKMGRQIMDLLLDLHIKQRKTLVIVTHDLRFARMKHLEKIFYLKDGKIDREEILK